MFIGHHLSVEFHHGQNESGSMLRIQERGDGDGLKNDPVEMYNRFKKQKTVTYEKGMRLTDFQNIP